MRDSLGCWRVDELSVSGAQLCLCLWGRCLPVAAIKTTAATIVAAVLNPLLLRPQQGVGIDMVDAELLLYLRELIVQGGFHRIVEVSDDNV
ncbi:unnamed protein product [Fusarium venenatum]|uniref:Uncharacterized protein n=1 Tax=Fusarium venenatum TaxID=56646 RepID=A0A2L2TK82_9HYPO|nr:uncharacterized protein FVRRES_00008 [Fusarium venenatum]CEI63496.1 unnamed protein product [Fusarium venenatum]